MIELYAKGTTDFSRHGIALAASEASVTWQDNGRYDMDMSMPYDPQIMIDYGMILRAPVPAQHVDTITLGEVSYWEIGSGLTDVPLYSRIPTLKKVGYQQWIGYSVTEGRHEYAVGDKVTYLDQNYQCNYFDINSDTAEVPPNNSAWWDEIPNTVGKEGKIAALLDAGDQIVKTGDYNSRYMKAADTSGHMGFVEISKCVDKSQSGTRTISAFDIKEQSFVITEIEKTTDGRKLTVHAEHISYQLGRTMLGDCNISRATPATALMFIRGAMQENYPGEVETNLTEDDGLITGDFSWKNAQNAILDPKSGILQATNAYIIRRDMDVYVLKMEEAAPRYRITYGTNMKAVKWDGNTADLVTRVYPLAQTEDGETFLLPELYIDTVREVPFIRPEALKTGLKIGQEEEQEDGTKVKLDEETVIARMREAAQNRFNIDECDKVVITLDVDWQHIPDTAEYAEYAALQDAAPGEWVEVRNAPLGIFVNIQMTGYTWDPIRKRYKKGTFGKKKTSPSVAGYDIQSGAVTGRTLAAGAVGGQNIQAGAITAREIEANAITADRIASRSIVTELLAAGAVTADEINAGAVTAQKIAAGAITAEKINADEVDAINAKLGVADIALATIQGADISFAQIKALTAESLIAHDAVTDRYYIRKLAVDNAQFVHATVGELIVKATDNHYYKLDIDENGALTTEDVTSTLSQGEITAGVTSDGHSTIIETDLAVTDLSASNMKAINALIDKISASRIDVQELFARQATIQAINTVDISGNTFLQLYVGENAYTKQSGIEITGDGIEVSGGKYVKIKAGIGPGGLDGGKLIIESGNFTIDASGNVRMKGTVTASAGSVIGGWTLGSNDLHAGSGSTYVAMASSGDYAFYAGSSTASSAPFRVGRDGTVTLTKLMAIGQGGTETEVNLRTAGLWKLPSVNVKDASYDSSTHVLTITRFSGGDVVVNFSGAGSVSLVGSWTGSVFTVEDSVSGTSYAETFGYTVVAYSLTGATTTIDTFNSSGQACVYVTASSLGGGNGRLYTFNIDASAAYNDGVAAGAAGVTLSGAYVSGSRTFRVTASNGQTYSETPTYTTGTGSGTADSITINSFSSAHIAYARVLQSSAQGGNVLFGFKIDASGQYSAGETAGANAAKAAVTLTGSWSGNTFTVTNSANNKTSATTISFSPTGNTINSFTNHSATITVSATGISGAMKTWTVNTAGEYNAGGATAKVNQTSKTLGYGASVTVTAQYVNASGTTVNTSSSCTITAPADNKGTGWTLAVGKVVMPGANTSASMSVTTPGSTYNTSGATTYYITVDNNYAYVKVGSTSGTVVARQTNPAYSNGANSVTLSAAGWVGGSNVVTASNGKSVTVNLPSISLTGGTTWSNHKTTVYASGGGASGSLASKEVDATSEYNAGWNACLDACGFGSYTKFYVGGSYARYAYSAPTAGATRYDYCRYGSTMASGHDVPARK